MPLPIQKIYGDLGEDLEFGDKEMWQIVSAGLLMMKDATPEERTEYLTKVFRVKLMEERGRPPK